MKWKILLENGYGSYRAPFKDEDFPVKELLPNPREVGHDYEKQH